MGKQLITVLKSAFYNLLNVQKQLSKQNLSTKFKDITLCCLALQKRSDTYNEYIRNAPAFLIDMETRSCLINRIYCSL